MIIFWKLLLLFLKSEFLLMVSIFHLVSLTMILSFNFDNLFSNVQRLFEVIYLLYFRP